MWDFFSFLPITAEISFKSSNTCGALSIKKGDAFGKLDKSLKLDKNDWPW